MEVIGDSQGNYVKARDGSFLVGLKKKG